MIRPEDTVEAWHALIAGSGLFDSRWYLARYRDVAQVPLDPVHHYLRVGAALGRAPGPLFDGERYLRENPDVAAAGLNPLLHYLRIGEEEGRVAHPCERAPIVDASAHLAALALARPSARPRRRLAGFDTGAAQEFMHCIDAVAAERGTPWPDALASIVMPARNRAALVGRAIDSVLAQTHPRWELLVVDDGSIDDTARVVAGYAADPRVRLLQGPARGVSAARNVALAQARGEWIFYLDSDNRWSPDFLRAMLAYLQAADRDSGYSGIALEDGAGRTLGYRGAPFDWDACLASNYVDLNSFCHRRALFDELGGFDETLRRMVDWDLILRYGSRAPPAYAPFIGCFYRDDASDASRVSVAEPMAYRSVVQAKHRLGGTPAPEDLAREVRLDFAIRIAAPYAVREAWGDFHFAESLKESLELLGHAATIRFVDGDGTDGERDQVSISLRGLSAHAPVAGQLHVLWNISHPDQVAYAEYEACDLAYVASASYPALLRHVLSRRVDTLLQCTDARRFACAADAVPGEDGRALFVGNSRGAYRDIVRWAVEAGIPLDIHGRGWEPFVPARLIASNGIANRELCGRYAAAGRVLNDHWESMREFGFVSNRVFDVLAAGGRLVSDPLPALEGIAGGLVVQVDSAASLAAAMARPDALPQQRERVRLARRVAAAHSFDARARWLCNDLLEHLGLPRIHAKAHSGIDEAPRPVVALVARTGSAGPCAAAFERVLCPLTTDAAHARWSVHLASGLTDPALASCAACVVQAGALSPEEAEALVERLQQHAVPLVVDADAVGLRPPSATLARANERLMAAAREVVFATPGLRQAFGAHAGSAVVAPSTRDPRLWRNYRQPPPGPVGDVVELLYLGDPADEGLAAALAMLDALAQQRPGAFRLTVADAGPGTARCEPRPWLRCLRPPEASQAYPHFIRWLASAGPFDAGLAPQCTAPVPDAGELALDYAALGLPTLLQVSPEQWPASIVAVLERRIDLRERGAATAAELWANRTAARSGLAGALAGLYWPPGETVKMPGQSARRADP